MFDRILFPTDGSETAERAFEHVLDIATTHDGTVHVLNVVDEAAAKRHPDPDAMMEAFEQEGTRALTDSTERAETQELSVVTALVRGKPSETIVEYGSDNDVDAIVMPTHGRDGVERLLLGSVTERVINAAESPVLTIAPDGDHELVYPYGDLLVPTDGSDGASLAVEQAARLAHVIDCSIHLLHVVERSPLEAEPVEETDPRTERVKEILAEASEAANSLGADSVTTSIVHGAPHREILSYVDDNDIDAVALGTQGHTDFRQYRMGGVTSKVVRTSPVPLLLVGRRAD